MAISTLKSFHFGGFHPTITCLFGEIKLLNYTNLNTSESLSQPEELALAHFAPPAPPPSVETWLAPL